jgi:propanol-preferring alcohol dehydrogenase
VTSVTANTRADGEEFLRLARSLELRPRVRTYRFEETDRALDDLAEGRFDGAAVIDLDPVAASS